MTLFIYCFLCIITIVLVFYEKKHLIVYIFALICLIVWSLVARTYSFQQDLLVYSDTMTYDWSFYKSFYVLREPVYWISSKLLYEFFENAFSVFFILDLIVFSLFVYVAYKKDIQPYFILLLILFFPNVMGFLNVYRQFISTILLLIAFLIAFEKPIKSKIIYMISVMTHNVGFIFLPYIFTSRSFFQVKFIFASLISIIAMIILSGSKSEVDTGETSPFLFFSVVFLGIIVFLLLNKFILTRMNIGLYYINLHGVLVSLFSVVFLSSAPAKRISMVALVFLLYSLYWFIEKNKKNIIIFRFLLVFFALIPSFLFSSVFQMLSYEVD